MKYNIKHLGQIKEGKMRYDDPKTFIKVINGLEGERVEVVVKKYKPYKQRSLAENSYYWAVIVGSKEKEVGLSYELGYQPDEIHEILKLRFLGSKKTVKGKDGKDVILCKAGSTSDLSTIEFEQFLSKIRMWASVDLGIILPEPNEVEF